MGFLPRLRVAHTQAESLGELNASLREVLALLLEDSDPQIEPSSWRHLPNLLRKIIEDIRLTPEEFLKRL